MAIISLFNLKGGVGKTTTCVNLASLAAQSGQRTLLVDLDPQGGASYQLKIPDHPGIGVENYLDTAKKLRKHVVGSSIPGLDILPAGPELRDLAIELDDEKHRRKHFRDILRSLAEGYDWLFIDSPPSITLEVENVIRACDLLLVPVIPTPMGVHAFAIAHEFLRGISIPDNQILICFSQVEKRKSIHLRIMDEIRAGSLTCLQTVIPFRSEIEKSSETGLPLALRRGKSEGIVAYQELWRELSSRKWPAKE